MKRSRILFAALLLSVVIAITAWSKEIIQSKQRNHMVFFPAVKQSADAETVIPLHAAVKEANIEKVRQLIEEGADVNEQNKKGGTAIWYAVAYGYQEIVAILLENGADINNRSEKISPLQVAVRRNDFDSMKLLIDNGADVNITTGNTRITSLHESALKDSPEAIDLLIAHGADVDAVNYEGMTPIFEAVYDRNIETMKSLVEYNADINHQDNTRLTPLHHATALGFKEGVKLLLNHGADTELKTKNDGSTPLHMAVIDGRKEIVEMLLQHGADINALNNYKQTALNIATYDEKVMSRYLKTGLATEEFTTEEITEALKVTREIIKLLIDNGA